MARRPTSGRERETAARARKVADKYFDLDTSSDEGAEVEADHLDDGYSIDPPGRRPPRRAAPPPAPPPPKFTPKERLFVAEYLVDFNGTQSAIRAGYSEKTAAVIAYENLRKPHIRALIVEAQRAQLEAIEWDAGKLKRRIGDELNADFGDLFDEAGNIKPIKDWPLVWRQGGILGGMKVRVEYDEGMPVANIVEIKTVVRTKQQEMMGKHVDVGAWRERHEHDASEKLLQAIAAQIEGTALRPKGGS